MLTESYIIKYFNFVWRAFAQNIEDSLQQIAILRDFKKK